MEFIKSLFNDDGAIVGLCGFEEMKPKFDKADKKGVTSGVNDAIFNPFISKRPSAYIFETNFERNVLLK